MSQPGQQFCTFGVLLRRVVKLNKVILEWARGSLGVDFVD